MSSTPRSKSEAEDEQDIIGVASLISPGLADTIATTFKQIHANEIKPGHQKPAAGLQKPKVRDVGDLRIGRVRVQADDPQKFFEAKYPNVFEHYIMPKSYSDKWLKAWIRIPMQFWQNQLNFAVWCATTGCGVSVDHLTLDDGFMKSVFRFHVYYQIRRILEEMQVPLPYDETWNAMENSYSRRGYEKICDEFGVSPNSNWKSIEGPNQGFGPVYYYWPPKGYIKAVDVHRSAPPGHYNPKEMSFKNPTEGHTTHVDYFEQETNVVSRAWRFFILNKSDGFTRAGVERLDDSIQTYVWAVLTAQVQIRTSIIGTGAAFRAQTQFQNNVETAITSPVDTQSAITRYQDVVQNASSEINFSFGEGLVMAPGDLLLRIGKIVGYNNNIIIATSAQSLGLNKGLNKDAAPPDAENDTGEKGLVKPMGTDSPSEAATSQHPATAKPHPATTTAADKADHEAHEDEKTALIVGSIAIGLGMLKFLG